MIFEDSLNSCKNMMINNTFMLLILLYVVVYVIINYNLIMEGHIMDGNYNKSIIVTGIIFLILYIFLTCDEESVNMDVNNNIPKYKIVNSLDKINNDNRYKLANSKRSSNLFDNDIFVSQQNKSKFGLNF